MTTKLMPVPLDEGFSLIEQKKYAKALRFFQENQERLTQNPHWYLGIAHAHCGLGHSEEALHFYKKAQEKNAEDPRLSLYIARLAYEIGDWQLARDRCANANSLEDFNQVIKVVSNALQNQFADHYLDWRHKRLKRLIQEYGAAWFDGKKILELGCGYGDIGMHLRTLGAEVTFLDARQEHLDVIKQRYPDINNNCLLCRDLNKPMHLPENNYDLIIHFGVLYHLMNWEESLLNCAQYTSKVVLETEVCDSDDPNFFLKINESGYDQAIDGQAIRPSGHAIENALKIAGFSSIMRLQDASCNSAFHVYDWEVLNTQQYIPGRRRMWFCEQA